ncbi:MAG: hypothetical protein V4622_11850 [Bacteroidota bacterium]
MKKSLFLVSIGCVLAFFLIQCSSKSDTSSPEALKERITELDDSLKFLYKEIMNDQTKEIPTKTIDRTIKAYLDFQSKFPKDKYSATCLDKVQQLYLQKKDYRKSMTYTNLLLEKYPKYEKRASLLLNAGSTSDMLNDKFNVERYYTMLLKENPNLEKETKEMVEFRLEHIDLTFEQLIELQMEKISKK